jgi:hypothetical protein
MPWSKIKLLKKSHNRGAAGAMKGVYIVPVGWDHWVRGLE